MSPLRWDVLLVGFVLALPVLAMGMRGDLSAEEVPSGCRGVSAAGLGCRRAVARRRHPADDARSGGQEAHPAGGTRRHTDSEGEHSPAH